MNHSKRNRSEIKIDESRHKPKRTFLQQCRDAFIAVVLGIVLVQIVLVQLYFFYYKAGFYWHGPPLVLFMYDNVFFLAWLAVCAMLGWVAGQSFVDWLNVKFKYWKSW